MGDGWLGGRQCWSGVFQEQRLSPAGIPQRCQAQVLYCVLPPQRPGYQLGWEFGCIFPIPGMEFFSLDFFPPMKEEKQQSEDTALQGTKNSLEWERKMPGVVLRYQDICLTSSWCDPLHMPGTHQQ